MKKLFTMVFAAAAMVGCSNDEILDLNQEAIAFGNAFVDNSTRAAVATDPSYTATSLGQFNVYGAVKNADASGWVNIFDGDQVSKGTAAYGDAWTIDPLAPTQYWIDGANYQFVAVVDATSVATDAAGLPVELTYDTATQKDMLCQKATTVGKPAGGLVSFTFTHLLSKVKFTVTNNTPATATGYRYTITNIVLTNANTEGVYDVEAADWDGFTRGTYALPALEVASNTTEVCPAEVLLVPGENDTDKVGIKFNVNVEMYNNATSAWEIITTTPKTYADVIQLKANTAYNFAVTVGLNETIEFTAMPVNEWTNAPVNNL